MEPHNPPVPAVRPTDEPSRATDLVLDNAATRTLIHHLRNLLLCIDAGDPIDPDDVQVLSLAVAKHDATSAYARVLRQGTWTTGRPGKGHFIWHGATTPNGIPVMRTWNGRPYVPVYRILWPLYRPDDCIGRPQRNERVCIDTHCANPMCFEFAIPIAVLGRDVAGTWRTRQEGKPARRPLWRGRTITHLGIEYPACEQCGTPLPPNGLSMEEYINRWMNKQRRCSTCEMAARHELERAGLRRMPRSYDHSDIEPGVRAAMVFNEDGTHGPAWTPDAGEYDPNLPPGPYRVKDGVWTPAPETQQWVEQMQARTPAQVEFDKQRMLADLRKDNDEYEAAQRFTRMLNEYDAQFVEDLPADDVDNAT